MKINRKIILGNIGLICSQASILFIVLLCGSAAIADKVVLKQGDTLYGNIKEQTDDQVILQHQIFGDMVINKTDIQSVNQDRDVETGQSQEKESEIEGGGNTIVDALVKYKRDSWKFNFSFSLDGSYGNTDEQSMRLGLKAKKRTTYNIFDIDSSYFHKIKKGHETDNKWTLGGRYRWVKPDSPWYQFVGSRYDFDAYKSWEQRASADIGLGYYLLRNDTFRWSLTSGPGIRKEWGSLNDHLKFELGMGSLLTWNITRRTNLDLNAALFPVMNDPSDYRSRLVAEFKYALDQEIDMNLVIGCLYEYQSVVDPGTDKKDLRIYTGFSFGY